MLNGAAKAVHHERTDESYPKTVIVKKVVEDVKAVMNDHLGTVRNHGQGQAPRDPNYTYGAKSNFDGVWNAAKCITGEATDDQLRPDRDLGRSAKPNCTNEVRRP